MTTNTEWQSYFERLTPQQLFVMATSRHGNNDKEVIREIAQASLTLPPLDFSDFGAYINLMGSLIERVVRQPESYATQYYKARGWKGPDGEYDACTLLNASDIINYQLSLQATHNATKGLSPEKRLEVLAVGMDIDNGNGHWNSLKAKIDCDISRLSDDGGYVSCFTMEELESLLNSEGIPVIKRVWSESAEVMKRVNIHLGGGEGNPIIRVVYSLGETLPAGFIATLERGDERLIQTKPLAPEDPLYLSPRDYALIQMRQNSKGMGCYPYEAFHRSNFERIKR